MESPKKGKTDSGGHILQLLALQELLTDAFNAADENKRSKVLMLLNNAIQIMEEDINNYADVWAVHKSLSRIYQQYWLKKFDKARALIAIDAAIHECESWLRTAA